MPLAFINNLNGWEIPVIIFVILLLFGGKKLPELARGAGKAIKEFKSATSEAEQTFKQAMEEDAKPSPQTTAQSTPTESTAQDKKNTQA